MSKTEKSGVDAASVAAAPSLEKTRSRELQILAREGLLLLALETIVRQSKNGHPIGHDAIVSAERLVKNNALDILGREPRLKCHCSVCAKGKDLMDLAN